MAKHMCCECDHMKLLQDEHNEVYYFCMFSESPCFLEETGVCSECELYGSAEDRYEELME